MMQSTSRTIDGRPRHTAIILDGNGRWAEARRLPRSSGHREGAVAVRRTVEAARALGLRLLTLYAFSSDNWRRPRPEVSALFALLSTFLRQEAERLRERGIRLTVIGRRDRLPASLAAEIEDAEAATAAGRDLHLRIAVD
jgi:undecaprenyl diphosphate synthase